MFMVHLGQMGDVLDDLELARRLNAQLRAGDTRLDFTGVLGVSPAFAAALLNGLDLGRFGNDLGPETMADAVAEVLAGGPGHMGDGTPGPVGPTVEPILAADEPVDAREVLNPIAVWGDTIQNYRDYLTTEFRARDETLRGRLEEALDRPRFLAQDAYFSTHIPFLGGKRWDELPLDPKLAAALARRTKGQPTFLHQQLAIEALLGPDAMPVVVTTGTGSGKTECFLVPALQAAIEDAVRHKGQPGLVGLILYPMNALANDQLERIQQYLRDSGYGDSIRVAVYNRGTIEAERERLRQRPPHLLLTNYQMLEYLLVRPADRESLFAGHRCRFVVLDEVHTYRGTLGTHVALLVRRLRAHLRRANPAAAPFLPIATSATIRSDRGASGDATEVAAAVREFFGKLAGISADAIRVIGEQTQKVVTPPDAAYATGPPPHDEGDLSDPAALQRAVCRLAGVPETTPHDEADRRCRILWDLKRWLGGRAQSIPDLARRLAEEVPGRAEWPEEDRLREIRLGLRIGALLPEGTPGSLQLRAHGFVRGGWQFHRCVDPECGTLHPKGEASCVACGKATAPLYLCRHCGADFLRMAGSDEGNGPLRPFPENGYLEEGDEGQGKEWLLYDPGCWTWQDSDADETQMVGDEDPPDGGRRKAKPRDAYRAVSGSFDPENLSFGLELGESRRRMSLWPTRKRCPACQNSGPRPVVTRVSLGTSAAVKVLAEGLLEALPTHASDPKKRLLVFCDSRQDAAHQARFIAYARRYDRMRTRVVRLLGEQGPQSIQKVVEGLARLGFEHGDNPLLPKIGQPRGETLEKVRAWEEAPLLDDLAINTRYRATLENLGLIRVVYDGIEGLVAAHGDELASGLKVPFEHQPYAIARLLDTLRRMGALRRPLLSYHPHGVAFPEVLKAAQWERRLMNPVGLPKGPNDYPALRCEPGDIPQGVSVKQVWSHAGFRTSAQKILLHFARRLGGSEPDPEGISRLFDLLAEASLLTPARLYGFKKDVELYQVSDDCLTLELAVEGRRRRCGVCALVVPDAPVGVPCPRCSGSLLPFADEQVRQSRYARRALDASAEALDAEEHTAQVSIDRRKEIEEAFKAKDRPTNLLACTPTLEMGIDVGGLDAIVLRNLPPRPDNYAQRGGRAGRRSRVGLVVGYARSTPHDQYFFDHADEMIAGAVPAPIFLLGNQDALTRHLYAIACGLATPGLPSRMGDLVTFEGQVLQEEVDKLKAALAAAAGPALAVALDAFGPDVLAEAGFHEAKMQVLLEQLPGRVQEAIDRTSVQVQKLRSVLDVLYKTGERKREAGRTVDLINAILGNVREGDNRVDDTTGAYPLRRLAEFGLLPGYEFPAEPATLRLLGDDDEQSLIQSGRELGLRQYQPNAPVYARGRRWKVLGVDMSSPWNPSGGQAAWQYARCGRCDLIRDPQTHPLCPRCGTAGAAGELPAISYAGFLARPDNTSVADEEERWGSRDNVQVHPSWDAERTAGRWRLPDGWSLGWRRGERMYWLNEGPETNGVRRRYALCPDCGKLLDDPPPEPAKKKGSKLPAKVAEGQDAFNHAPNCPRRGQPVAKIALYAERRVETLRLLFPWPGKPEQGDRLESWAWSLGYALLAGAERLFALTSRDFEVQFEGTRPMPAADGTSFAQGILTFIDPNLGGSGYLERFAQRLPDVATASLKHLEHDGCETACYRCLKSYDNQRHHEVLRWPLVVSTLEGLREDEPVAGPLTAIDLNDPRPWREAFESNLGSPLEYRCLMLLEAARLEPVKQFPIADPATGRVFTITDFAFPDRRVAVYVDGVSIHVGEVLRRDRLIEERLRGMTPAWTVLRFGRWEIDVNTQHTIEQIRIAIG